MADSNHTPVTIYLAGLELQTIGAPADLHAFADVLLRSVQRALHQETADPVQLEDHERYALGELVGAARDAMRGLVREAAAKA